MKKLLISSSLAVLISGGVFTFSNMDASAGEELPVKAEDKVVVVAENVAQNDKIKYLVTKDHATSSELEVTVELPGDISKNDMKDYQLENKKNIEKLSKKQSEVPATITFTDTITVETFENLVKHYNVDVESFNLMATDSEGSTQFIQGVPEGGSIVHEDKLKSVISGGELLGIYSFKGTVHSSSLRGLEDKSNIYLVDVSQEILTEKYKGFKEKNEHLDVNVYDVFWFVNERL